MKYNKEKMSAAITILLMSTYFMFISSCTTKVNHRHPKVLKMSYSCDFYDDWWEENWFTLYKDSLVCYTNNSNTPSKVFTAKELGIDLEGLIQAFYYKNNGKLTYDFSLEDSKKEQIGLHSVIWSVNGQDVMGMHLGPLYFSKKNNDNFWVLDQLLFDKGKEYNQFVNNYKPKYHHGNEINRVNSRGEKTGKWVTYNEHKVMVSRYKRGLLDGLYEIFTDSGFLTYTTIYKMGKMVGPSYAFEEDGICYAYLGIKNNSDYTYLAKDDGEFTFDKQTFSYDFWYSQSRLYSSGSILLTTQQKHFFFMKYPMSINREADIKEYNEPKDYLFIKQFSPNKAQ